MFVLFVVGVIISFASGHSHIGHWTSNNGGSVTQNSGVSVNLTGVWFVAWLVIALLYHFFAELETGQTIGKRIMGLKVIMVSGRPLDARAVLLRTLGRVVDVLPVFYLVGWITMRGPHTPPQRLGDRLAGTTVAPISHP